MRRRDRAPVEDARLVRAALRSGADGQPSSACDRASIRRAAALASGWAKRAETTATPARPQPESSRMFSHKLYYYILIAFRIFFIVLCMISSMNYINFFITFTTIINFFCHV